MSRLAEYWQIFKEKFVLFVRMIEESVVFERLMNRYEGLTLEQKKYVQVFSKTFFMGLFLFLFLYPLVSLVLQRSKLSDLQEVQSRLSALELEMGRSQLEIRTPVGWQRLDASNMNVFQTSLSSYLNSIGVPADIAALSVRGGLLHMSIQDMSLRQLVNMSFQIEGLYPALQFQEYRVSVHAENKETLDFEGRVSLNPALAQRIAASGAVASPPTGGRPGSPPAPSPLPAQPTPPPPAPENLRPSPMPSAPRPQLPETTRRESRRDLRDGRDDRRDDYYDDPRDVYLDDYDRNEYLPHDVDDYALPPPDDFINGDEYYDDIPPDMIPPPPPIFDDEY